MEEEKNGLGLEEIGGGGGGVGGGVNLKNY